MLGHRQVTVLGAIAIMGLIGGVAVAVYGAVIMLGARGSSGLGAIMALGVALGGLLLGAMAIVPAALLARAVSILSKPGHVHAAASPRRRLITVVAAAGVLASWMAPAVLLLSAGSAASLDVTFSLLAVGVGVVAAATAFGARDLLARPLGMAMLLIPLISVILPLWIGSEVVGYQGRQRDNAAQQARYAAEQAHFEERFAEILQGPTINEVAAEVGDVGTWRLLGGGVTPMQRDERWLDRQETLTDLGGSAVRFAFVAQCSADFDGGRLLGAMSVFGSRKANGDPLDSWSLEPPVVPCDGRLHVDVSDAVVLPDWDAPTLAGAGRDWKLVMTYTVVTAAQPLASPRTASNFQDYGERWLVFVAPEPAPPSEPLLVTVGAHLSPLRPR